MMHTPSAVAMQVDAQQLRFHPCDLCGLHLVMLKSMRTVLVLGSKSSRAQKDAGH